MKVYICIVVYNSLIKELNNLKYNISLIRNDFSFIPLIFDNSIDISLKKENFEFCENNKLKYIDNQGNIGLSKSYNKAINYLENGDYLFLLDQDTKLSDDYFSVVKNNILENSNICIFVPRVIAQNKSYISPASFSPNGYKIVSYKKNLPITAINSGMIIKKEVFDIVGKYDERYFLDYIDHYFMRKCNKNNIPIIIINVIIKQNFALFDFKKEKWISQLNRFYIFKKDFKLFCQGTFKGRFYYYSIIIKIALVRAWRFKKPQFIAALFKKNEINKRSYI